MWSVATVTATVLTTHICLQTCHSGIILFIMCVADMLVTVTAHVRCMATSTVSSEVILHLSAFTIEVLWIRAYMECGSIVLHVVIVWLSYVQSIIVIARQLCEVRVIRRQ